MNLTRLPALPHRGHALAGDALWEKPGGEMQIKVGDNTRATPAQTPAHPDPLSEATLRPAKQLRRDTWLFLSTALAAHAAVIVNLVAVLKP